MIGQKLGSFRIEGVLGSGAMGIVYRGTHEGTGRPVAVKVILGDVLQKGNLGKRFEREAVILKEFRHPNIVRFLAYGRSAGTTYIAMEFIDGHTLEKELEDRGPLPWREVVDLGIQICEALEYAHERQVVHRDLKPSNLMLTSKRKVKLTDFGIAKDLDASEDLTATGRTLGTAAYMAPEQIKGNPPVSHKTDLYALGVILYQMLTGEPPFEGNTAIVLMHAHVSQDPPRVSAKLHEIPKALDRLVFDLMAKEIGRRPFDAAAVAVTLGELRDKAERGEAVEMVWPTFDPDAPPPRADAPTLAAAHAAGGETRSRRTRRKADEIERGGGWLGDLLGPRAETALLVVALLAVGGLIGYMVWPPGPEYLYERAGELMASEEYTDWLAARSRYLDPLDSGHPDHPFKQETERWRDQIALAEARRRAGLLERPVGALGDPQGAVESKYVSTFQDVQKAQRMHDDPAALAAWRALLAEYREMGKEARGWDRLVDDRAAALERQIEDRKSDAAEEALAIEVADRTGQVTLAARLRAEYLERYGAFPDLAELVERVRRSAPPPAPKAVDGPQP